MVSLNAIMCWPVDDFEVSEGAVLTVVNSWTTAMPLMCSWVKLLIRAIAARTRR